MSTEENGSSTKKRDNAGRLEWQVNIDCKQGAWKLLHQKKTKVWCSHLKGQTKNVAEIR